MPPLANNDQAILNHDLLFTSQMLEKQDELKGWLLLKVMSQCLTIKYLTRARGSVAERSKALRSGRSLPWRRGFESHRYHLSFQVPNSKSETSALDNYSALLTLDANSVPKASGIQGAWRLNPLGINDTLSRQVVWPSGLRRWIKAPVSLEAWVQIPPLPQTREACLCISVSSAES